ncbi:MAG: hypothetical protein ACM3MN_02715 [Nitrospirota bacterium]
MKAKATGHERLKQALALAETVKTVLVATADSDGCPHVAAAGKIEALPDGRVAVSEWFCPGTVSNLEKNPASPWWCGILAPTRAISSRGRRSRWKNPPS